MTNIRSVMGAMDLDQILSHRDEINERLLRVVDAAVSPWGVKVNRIEIKDIVPPADLVESMGRQMKAEREKRAEILTAEGQRQSAILKAEGAKQSQILEAEGRKEAAFRDAEARERSAQAEAKATEVVSQAVANGDVAALNYFVAQQYLKALADRHSPNQKILMLPIEATSVLASLGGIAEIAKATLAKGALARRRRCRQPARHRPEDIVMWMWIVSIGAWNWFILAALLFLIEILAPGSFMMWLGLAAILVGVISSVAMWPWQAQVIAFAVFAIAAIPAWRRFTRKSASASGRPSARRARALVGRGLSSAADRQARRQGR